MYNKSINAAIQEILNKDIKTIKKDIEEAETVAGDIAIQDKPLFKKKKVVKRDSLEN